MSQYTQKSPASIIENDKKVRVMPLLVPIEALAIYSVIIPVLLLDAWMSVYQAIYFTILDIPKVHKKDYIIFDRWQLHKLNFFQRINCVYCEYVNGLLAWAKGVSNQTEIYSCAIKHSARRIGQENEVKFYKYDRFK